MTESQAMTEKLLKLDNGAYLDVSDETLQALGVKLAPSGAEKPPPGAAGKPVPPIFAIGAPNSIESGFKGTIPALMAKRQSGLRLWEVNTEPNLHIVLTNLRTGEARVYSPFVADKRRMVTPPRSKSGPEPDAIQRGSTLYGVEKFGIPPMFGDDWPAGAFSTSVIFYDWLSNAVRTENPGFKDTGPLLPVTPSALLKPVEAKGVEGLSGTASITVEALVEGALRRKTVDGGEAVPVSILVIQLDEQQQQMIRFAIPIPDGAKAAAAQFDLRAAWPGQPLRGECLLYLNVSGRITGPHKVTL